MRRGCATLAAALLLAVVPGAREAAAQQEAPRFYLRASLGYDKSRDATLSDRSCDPAPLLIYFGCGTGVDGQRMGAYGDFGRTATGELALGMRALPVLRVELALLHRPGFGLSANANFVGAGAHQPVVANFVQTAAIARTFLDLPLFGLKRVAPFLGAGLGRSRNRIDSVFYAFPDLTSKPATTTTLGGTTWDLAWDLSAGTGVRVAPHTLLEFAYRYSDLGRVETADGPIDVVRGTRTQRVNNVAGTATRLRSHGMYFGFRQEF